MDVYRWLGLRGFDAAKASRGVSGEGLRGRRAPISLHAHCQAQAVVATLGKTWERRVTSMDTVVLGVPQSVPEAYARLPRSLAAAMIPHTSPLFDVKVSKDQWCFMEVRRRSWRVMLLTRSCLAVRAGPLVPPARLHRPVLARQGPR